MSSGPYGPIFSPEDKVLSIVGLLKFVYTCLHKAVDLKIGTFIGGSRGHHRLAPPSTGHNSFVFVYVFAKKHPYQRLASSQWDSVPQQEILDPPLTL